MQIAEGLNSLTDSHAFPAKILVNQTMESQPNKQSSRECYVFENLDERTRGESLTLESLKERALREGLERELKKELNRGLENKLKGELERLTERDQKKAKEGRYLVRNAQRK